MTKIDIMKNGISYTQTLAIINMAIGFFLSAALCGTLAWAYIAFQILLTSCN
tara:strand:- start:694 stop:849 length:156 start_codon:yes stop_codon:yes gene_type:complete